MAVSRRTRTCACPSGTFSGSRTGNRVSADGTCNFAVSHYHSAGESAYTQPPPQIASDRDPERPKKGVIENSALD